MISSLLLDDWWSWLLVRELGCFPNWRLPVSSFSLSKGRLSNKWLSDAAAPLHFTEECFFKCCEAWYAALQSCCLPEGSDDIDSDLAVPRLWLESDDFWRLWRDRCEVAPLGQIWTISVRWACTSSDQRWWWCLPNWIATITAIRTH